MRFLVDECTGSLVAKWLKEEGHTVFSVYDEARGSDDVTLIDKAYDEDYIIITNDKDFGELVFRLDMEHKGVILLRLEDERSNNKIEVLRKLLRSYKDHLKGNFTVITEDEVRITEG
ncbi:MAG: DUF5615 family PIN-like protein [Thermoplasmata archaeon]